MLNTCKQMGISPTRVEDITPPPTTKPAPAPAPAPVPPANPMTVLLPTMNLITDAAIPAQSNNTLTIKEQSGTILTVPMQPATVPTPPAKPATPSAPIEQPNTGSTYSAWDIQSDAATIARKSLTEAIKITSTTAPLADGLAQKAAKISSYATPLMIIDYAKEAKKEGVTLRDMYEAWRDLPDIVKWSKNNPDEAFNALAEGSTKAAAVAANGALEVTLISPVTRLVTGGKVDPQITSQQIQSGGQKIGNIDWKSLPLLR